MADYRLRPAQPDDLRLMSNLWAQKTALLRQLNRRYQPLYRDRTRFEASLLAAFDDPQRHVVTAWHDGQLVGHIVGALDPSASVGQVLDLTTELHTSQSGIGRQLYHELRAWFISAGASHIEVTDAAPWAVQDAFWRAMGAERHNSVYRIDL